MFSLQIYDLSDNWPADILARPTTIFSTFHQLKCDWLRFVSAFVAGPRQPMHVPTEKPTSFNDQMILTAKVGQAPRITPFAVHYQKIYYH